MNKKKSAWPPAAGRVQKAASEASGNKTGKDNQHNRDISSKAVLGNAVLCAQFLRDNLDMPMLKDIQPEDIEDISERFYPYLGSEMEADSVMKIRILDIEKKKKDGSREPSFLVSLVEHKSLVDYDVSMQLLRYMLCIWTEYRREKEAEREGSTRQKGFRYPVIIPIVYYEGKAEWTADTHLSARIGGDTGGREWIPDFQYEVIRLHDFNDQELLERGDEMSLIMLINKIQNTADLERFIRIPAEKLDRIIRDSPEHIVDVMVSVMESLCFKIDISAEERLECVRKVKKRNMGYLFESMEKISIQEERRKTEEQRKKTEEERRKTEKQRKKAEEARKKAEEAYKKAEEEGKRAEEAHRKAEEEGKRAEEAYKKAEEEGKRAEEAYKKAEEEGKRAEEAHRKAEEEGKRAEEAHRKAEEEGKRAEEQRKKAEEEHKRAETAERERKEVEEELRLAKAMIAQLKDKYQLEE